MDYLKVEGLRLAIGGRTTGEDSVARSLRLEDISLTNEFLAIRGLEDFKRFYARYGFPMFESLYENQVAYILKKGVLPDGRPGLVPAPSETKDNTLKSMFSPDGSERDFTDEELSPPLPEDVWARVQVDIWRIQKNICWLMEHEGEREFHERLSNGLSGVRMKSVRDQKTEGCHWLVLHAKGIKEACLLQLALGNKRIETCVCGNPFLQTKNKTYCSDACRNVQKSKERRADGLKHAKHNLRSRLDTRFRQRKVTREQEQTIREYITEANSLEELDQIEDSFPVLKAQRNREPHKREPKTAKKGEA